MENCCKKISLILYFMYFLQILNIVSNNKRILSNWNITGMMLSTSHTLLHNLKCRSCHRYFTEAEMEAQKVCYPEHVARGGRGGFEQRFPESKSWQCLT